jgi:N-succinyl-L-ornithine transcarbamylase
MDAKLTITHPEGYELKSDITNGAYVTNDQNKAFKNADFIYAKNWSSFNNDGKVLKKDRDWMITKSKMNLTNNAKFMHCLPIRRNVVASDEVIDSNNSLILNQVENRIYSAQSVLKTIVENG